MQDYKDPYHVYPVFSQDTGFEPSVKRYQSFPTPEDVYNRALAGLPKFFPMTKEVITPAFARTYLEVAITDIEMDLGLNISPVQHDQSFDYVDGLFEKNWTGLKLERWPATSIVNMCLKYPHTQGTLPQNPKIDGTSYSYMSWTIPASWIALRRNRINVVAGIGTITPNTNSAGIAGPGILSYITGYGRGPYQPALIEVSYIAGFPNDKLPTTVWDAVILLASIRMLQDIAAPLFPNNGVSVSIDAVSQSASTLGPQTLLARIDHLKDQWNKKEAMIKKLFGQSFKMAFIGA